MPIGPFSTYTPPGVYGPGASSRSLEVQWAWGQSPMPPVVRQVLSDLCMSNVAHIRAAKLPRWMSAYFARRRKASERRARKDGQAIRPFSTHSVEVDFSDGMLRFSWSEIARYSVSMPKELLVPQMVSIIAVHEC